MRKMTNDEKISATAVQIDRLMRERLDGPKDAAKALLISHVKLTIEQGFDRQAVADMLEEYGDLFRLAYFGASH